MTLDQPLDHFEQTLLTELRGHVASRTPASARSRTRRWRWAALPAAAALAIGAGFVTLQPSASAYAVSESGDEVVVTIKRLDDADGLERALRAHGIDADVDYSGETPPPPPDAVTKQDGGTDKGAPGSGTVTRTERPGGPATGPAPERAAIDSSMSKDGLTLRIDKSTLPDDAVVHITTSGSLDAGVSGLKVEVIDER
jgi:hypothetical protein